MVYVWAFVLFILGSGMGLCNGNSIVERHLLTQIKKMYGEEERITVQFHNLPKDLKDERNVKAVIITKLPDHRGDGQAAVEIEEKQGRKRTAYVSFRVSAMKKFYVLKRDMKKGEIIKADDVYERKTFLNDCRLYPSSIEDIEGKKLKKDALANTVITKELLEDSYAVKRGEIVTIKMENERMKIIAKAISLEKGKIGDMVKLKNVSSGREIMGVVSGEKEVTVVF